MKPGRRHLLPTVLIAALTGLGGDRLLASEHSAEARLETVRNEIERLKSRLDRSRGERRELQGGLREIEIQLGRLNASLRTVNTDLARTGSELKTLEQQRETLHGRLDEQRLLLATQIRAAYAMGRQERVKMLLNQQDPARMGRVLAYYDYLNRARSRRIDDTRDTLNRLDKVEEGIRTKQAELTDLRQRREREGVVLAEAGSARRQLLDRLERDIRSRNEQLTQLQADEARLLRLIEELTQRRSTETMERTPFARQRGKLRWPTRGRITARFGQQRPVGKLRWQGVLIDAPAGRDVRAISNGRVAFADWLRGFGLLIIIDHGDGFMSLYGQNQSLYKETGDWVEPGEIIAGVGASGGRKSAGLYFEIRRDGRPVDPKPWLVRGRGLNVGMNWPDR